MKSILTSVFVFLIAFQGCTNRENIDESEAPANPSDHAIVTSVVVSGNPGDFTFSVTVSSPDSGCEHYADWWEVLTVEGQLLYRRVLLHSHVGEQPFSRTGGPLNIKADEVVLVRAHMNDSGYGTSAMEGSFATGFESKSLAEGFAEEVEKTEPLPVNCAF